MAVNHVRHLSQGRADTPDEPSNAFCRSPNSHGRPAAATNHHAVHAGLLNHAHRILGGENIAITQDRHIGNQLTQLRNRIPVSLTRIMLSRSTTVQTIAATPGITRNLGGLQERNVVIVDALRILIVSGISLRDASLTAVCTIAVNKGRSSGGAAPPPRRVTLGAGQQVQVNGQHGPLLQPCARPTAIDRVTAVNLNGTNLLVRVMLNNAHGLGLTRSTRARAVTISVTYRPPPADIHCRGRRSALLVTPAIGARTTGVSTVRLPSLGGGRVMTGASEFTYCCRHTGGKSRTGLS